MEKTMNNATETLNSAQQIEFSGVAEKYDGLPHQIEVTAIPEAAYISF